MNRMDSLAPTAEGLTQTIPPTARLSVARQQQSHNLSCESSAASMVAQYHGVQLSEEEVLASLPASSNPHLGFRGNVDGPTGGTVDYGVYAEPILDILNARGLQARTVVDGMEGIKAAIARGNPVIAWVTYNCEPSTPTTTVIDGQKVTLVPNQHVVVVTGFNAEGVWANDPWDGQEDFYQTGDFERAMSYFGNMAVEIAKSLNPGTRDRDRLDRGNGGTFVKRLREHHDRDARRSQRRNWLVLRGHDRNSIDQRYK